MKIHSLKALMIFKVLFEETTTTKTAAFFSITQSGVSRSISNLENSIGIQLFIRNKNRLIATPEAGELYKYIIRLESSVEELDRGIETLKEFGVPNINIISIPGLSFGILPKTISKIISVNSQSMINFDIQSSKQVIERLENGVGDIGLVTLPVRSEKLIIEPLISSEAVCILSGDNELAKKKSIDVSMLHNQHVIVPIQKMIEGNHLLLLIKEYGVKISGKTEANISSIYNIVSSGVGISVINKLIAMDLHVKNDNVAIRPFTPITSYDFAIVYRKNWENNPILKEIKDSIINLAKTYQ
ncbi:MAG: LysR family transcriptional regulator [Ostreibacterium sp.]